MDVFVQNSSQVGVLHYTVAVLHQFAQQRENVLSNIGLRILNRDIDVHEKARIYQINKLLLGLYQYISAQIDGPF